MRKVLVYGALTVIALVIGASSANATIIFGNIDPGGCGPASGPGHVCQVTETFTSGADTIVVNGFSGAPLPGTGDANLTLKGGPDSGLLPLNVLGESGIGVNAPGNTGPNCSDEDCEIFPPQSVTAVSTGSTLIEDALIGSVQGPDTFKFFVQSTLGGPFVQLGGVIGSTCIGPGFSVAGTDLCRWDAPPGQTRFGVAVQAVNVDVLLTEVSTVGVPEPSTMALLGTALVGLGLVRRRRA